MVQLGNLYLNNGGQIKAEEEYQAATEYRCFTRAHCNGKLLFIRNDNEGAIQFFRNP
jgi:hypothetical protein